MARSMSSGERFPGVNPHSMKHKLSNLTDSLTSVGLGALSCKVGLANDADFLG